MIVAKLAATAALVLFVVGAAGAGGTGSIAAGCVLFLVAAVIGAVVLEGRDLEPAAALLPRAEELEDAPIAVQVSQVTELPTAA